MIKKLLYIVMSFPKTLWVNLRIFPLKQAIKLPVVVPYHINIGKIHRNCIVIKDVISRNIVSFGVYCGSYKLGQGQHSFLNIEPDATLVISNYAHFGSPVYLNITKTGKVVVGRNFSSNSGLIISCENSIIIGNDIAIGWDVTIIDSDGHTILVGAQTVNTPREVVIGNNCWICAKASVLKGAVLPDSTIVAYGTIVSKNFKQTNTVIAGWPCQVIKENIEWRK